MHRLPAEEGRPPSVLKVVTQSPLAVDPDTPGLGLLLKRSGELAVSLPVLVIHHAEAEAQCQLQHDAGQPPGCRASARVVSRATGAPTATSIGRTCENKIRPQQKMSPATEKHVIFRLPRTCGRTMSKPYAYQPKKLGSVRWSGAAVTTTIHNLRPIQNAATASAGNTSQAAPRRATAFNAAKTKDQV
jgi:hypothetical protein